MTGFDIFLPYQNRRHLLSRHSTHCRMVNEEADFLATVYQTLKDPAVGPEFFLLFHEKADMVFISDVLTEKQENKYQKLALFRIIPGIGYPYIDVSGYYGAPQDTYCVLNYAEDTRRFIIDMRGLTKLCGQESALIIPQRGWGNDLPFLYYSGDDQENYTANNDITKEIKNYFARHEFYPQKSPKCSYADFIARIKKTLRPIRFGYTAGGVCSTRIEFRKDVSDLFGLRDEDYFKSRWR